MSCHIHSLLDCFAELLRPSDHQLKTSLMNGPHRSRLSSLGVNLTDVLSTFPVVSGVDFENPFGVNSVPSSLFETLEFPQESGHGPDRSLC
jgi:hypothetical protein